MDKSLNTNIQLKLRPLIVALGYKKDSGKNTFAKFLSTHLRCTTKFQVLEVSFAEKLKDICWQLYKQFGLKKGIYYETHRNEKEVILPGINKSPRQIWIEVGNKLREVYQDTWIDFALDSTKADIIIITDLGFVNEAKKIRARNGYLIKISRPDRELGTDGREIELDTWTDFDLHVLNNGSLDDLYTQVLTGWEAICEIETPR